MACCCRGQGRASARVQPEPGRERQLAWDAAAVAVRWSRPVEWPKIPCLGLDGAGKTAVVHYLRTGAAVHAPPPTPATAKGRPSFTKLTARKDGLTLRASVADVPGAFSARRTAWRSAVAGVDGVMYVVDASDPSRLPLARFELDRLLQREPDTASIPLLIFANKTDLETSLSLSDVAELMDLHTDPLAHPLWRLEGGSVWAGRGVHSSLRWLMSGRTGGAEAVTVDDVCLTPAAAVKRHAPREW